MKSLFLNEWDSFIRYFDLAGDDPAYVYLPGLTCASMPTLLSVATHPHFKPQRSILVDYFGCGFSENPAHFSHSMADHARTVAAILDAENLRETVVIGHSMGGTVGLYLALQRPDLVSALVMAESNIDAGGGSGTRKNAAMSEAVYVTEYAPKRLANAREKGRDGDTSAAWYAGMRRLSAFEAVYRDSVGLVELDEALRQQFFDLSIQRGFIYGEKVLAALDGDTMPDVPDRDLLHQHGIVTAVVPDSGHMMFLDNLEGYVEAIQTCLNVST